MAIDLDRAGYQDDLIDLPENRKALRALLFGCARTMEIAASVAVRIKSTDTKLFLSRAIWSLAKSAELIKERCEGLRGGESWPLQDMNPVYTSFFNNIVLLRDPDLEYRAIMTVVLPDLCEAIERHRERVPRLADEWTSIALDEVNRLLEPLHWSFVENVDSLIQPARELSYRCVSVSHTEAEECEPVTALPAIPIRPGREDYLVEARPHQEVAASGYGSVLHDSIFRVELAALEICAANIAHHREAPWGLKLDLARQVRDEGRHFELFESRMTELGTKRGDFPIHFDVWDKYLVGQTLAERLIIEQRLGEGTGLDGAAKTLAELKLNGDGRSATIFDYVTADEVVHVRNGNRWLRELLNDRSIEALEQELRDRLAQRQLGIKNKHPINVIDRSLGGFSEAEISELSRRWIDYNGR